MRVKIGDQWFSSDDQPICVELTDQDKSNIENMDPDATRYAVFPDALASSVDEKYEWMAG